MTTSARCRAHSKRSGEQCRLAPVRGKQVCYYHGGASPSGIGSPHFRHGRYSKDLPTWLADRFRAAMRDPNLIALTNELALVDAAIGNELAGLPADPAAMDQDRWDQLLQLIEQRRKLCDSERRRLELLDAHLTLTQALTLIAGLQQAVVEVVSDPVVRRQVALRFEMIMTHTAPRDRLEPRDVG